MGTPRIRRSVAVGASMLLILAGCTGGGDDRDERAKLERRERRVFGEDKPARPARPDEKVVAQLRDIAGQQGSVRLIAGFDVPTRLEGELDPAATKAQRDAIATASAALEQALVGQRFTITRRYVVIPYVAIDVSPQALDILARSPMVTSLEEDRRFQLGQDEPIVDEPTPTAEVFWDVDLVRAPVAWGLNIDGTGQIVAILDTGVDRDHPYLKGKVIDEACFAETGCPNGETEQSGPDAAKPCPGSLCDHGTHVAGTAAGARGVAKGATILAAQIFDSEGKNVYLRDALKAMEWVMLQVRDRGINVASINMSIAGGGSTTRCDSTTSEHVSVRDMALQLLSVGVVTVASSGNDGYVNGLGAPACISTIVSVGNTTRSDDVNDTSNSADFLWLLAPGTEVESSVPGGGFGVKTGTSMAAPHVAGAVALLKQKHDDAKAVVQALVTTGTAVTDRRNGVETYRIDVAAALKKLSAAGPR